MTEDEAGGSAVALLVVDMQRGFTDRLPELAEPAIIATQHLLKTAQANGAVVVYTVQIAPGGPFEAKLPGLGRLKPDSEFCEIEHRLAPASGEPLVEKKAPSAFFGTRIADLLREKKVRNVLVAGTSTSGCVRATVVDGMSEGFPMYLVEDAVFDRNPVSAAAALDDVRTKYGEVVSLETALALLGREVVRVRQ